MIRPGSVGIEVWRGEATGGGFVKHEVFASFVHQGYLSTSGVERFIARLYEDIERRVREETGGSSQPPVIILNAPPGAGKTFTLLRFLEAVRRRAEVFGIQVSMAIYLAPYKSILSDIREAYKRIVHDYDPARRPGERFYLLYRSPRDCKIAQGYKELVELWGSEEIACKVCPYRFKHGLGSNPLRLGRILRHVAVAEGRALDAPIIDVLPRGEGETCLRNLAVQMALLFPTLRSKRRALIAGLIGSFQSLLNPSYAKIWESLTPADNVKMLVFDEFDMLLTEPVMIRTELPIDLYPSEKEVLAGTVGLSKYNEMLRIMEALVEDPRYMMFSEVKAAVEKLSVLEGGALEEICKRCVRKVLEEREPCRLCNPLRSLSFIVWFLRRAVEAGYNPIYSAALLLTNPESYNYSIILGVSREQDRLVVTARPVWWGIRLLIDPFYPSTLLKVLSSATSDVIIAEPGKADPAHMVLTSIRYGSGILVDVKAKYRTLEVLLIEADESVYRAIEDTRSLTLYTLSLADIFNSGEGREQRLIYTATFPVCVLLGTLVETIMGRGKGLVFANSKRNAEIVSDIIAEYLSWKGVTPFKAKTSDFIVLEWSSGSIYVTWYRSRVSRGVSSFAPVNAASVLLWQSDPPTESLWIHHTYRQAASTVQSLFRIIRSIRPGLKKFIMFDFVWEYLVRNGPSWLEEAASVVERYSLHHAAQLPAIGLCEANLGRLKERLTKIFK